MYTTTTHVLHTNTSVSLSVFDTRCWETSVAAGACIGAGTGTALALALYTNYTHTALSACPYRLLLFFKQTV